MTMRATRIPVAVEFERVAVASRWADSRWQPSRVVPVEGDPDAADGAAVERVDATDVLERWRFPGQLTEMHPVEAEGYYLATRSPRASTPGAGKRARAGRPADRNVDGRQARAGALLA